MIWKLIKNIFTSKKAKKVLFVLVLLFVCYLAFSLWADCLADGTTPGVQQKMTNFNEIASEVIKCLYVLLWPLIFICWIALDNSLVYGTWLHLDAPLWSLWNIMKNIANFALWWLVLFSILKNLLSTVWKWEDSWKPLKIIKNTLIAGILIQMSWFLVAAVIDLSTVLTYAVWWLPLTVLKSNPEYSGRPVMSLSINVWSDANGMKPNIYYTYWDHKISDCLILNNLSMSWSYILWPKVAYLWDSYNDTWIYMDTWYCALWWWPYRYNHLLSGDGGIYHDIYSIWETWALKNQMYVDFNNSYRPSTSWDLQVAIDNCQIIPVDDTKIPQTCRTDHYWALPFSGNDEFFRWSNSENTILYTVDNLIEESKWFVWPLITIYSSLLDIQSFVDIWSESYVETFISLLFKFVFFVVLIAPLIWLALVLIVRVWILWIVIATSPVLILIWVFWDVLKPLKDVLWKNFDLWNIVKLVFAPVIITLAISISLIFINAISGIRDRGQLEYVFDSLWIQTDPDDYNSYSILGLVDIELNTTLIWKWKNDFAYFIMLLFSTAIIRFFLIEALKMCGGAWEKIWWFMEKNFKNMLENAPIIPLPWGSWRVWIKQIADMPGILTNKVVSNFKNTSEENMKTRFGWLYPDSQDQLATKIVEKIKKNEITSLTNSEIGLLAPIFKTRDEKQIIQMASQIDEKDLETLVKNSNSYNPESGSYASSDVAKIAEVWANIPTQHTSADALQLTKAQLDIAVQNDESWIDWAKGMIWWAVHTSDWVYIVDVIPWTELNPIYRIMDRNGYETLHFGVPIESVTKDKFDEWSQSSEAKQRKMADDMRQYLDKMDASNKELEVLKQENETNKFKDWSNESIKLWNLEKIFDESLLKKLQELDGTDNRFKVPEPQQWQQS